MKMKYESPELEVYVFNTQDAIMDSGGDCIGFECPDGICVFDYGGGGGCWWDIHISGL